MQLPRRRPHPHQPRLQFMDPSQAELWTSLSAEQRQTCQELLSQLLQQIVSQQDKASEADERSDCHE